MEKLIGNPAVVNLNQKLNFKEIDELSKDQYNEKTFNLKETSNANELEGRTDGDLM